MTQFTKIDPHQMVGREILEADIGVEYGGRMGTPGRPNPKLRAREKKVLIWEDYPRWRPGVLRILDFVDSTIFDYLRANPPGRIHGDNTSWLSEAVDAVKGFYPDCKALLVEGLKTEFDSLRAYHGCRPLSLDSYHQNGLLPSDTSALKAIAHEIFTNKAGVDRRILELQEEDGGYEQQNHGRIYFCLTKEELIEDCGHYLLYGSEYLQAIASHIGERDVLRKRGKATIFECHVPIQDIGIAYLDCLAGLLLERIGKAFLRWQDTPDGGLFGFHISVPVLPHRIVGADHPQGIPDPHNYRVRAD